VSITDQKASLRKGLIKARPTEPLTPVEYDFMAQAIGALRADNDAQITAYLPIRRELDPLPLIERLGAFPVGLPRTPDEPAPLDFRLWSPGEDLDEGLFNTMEPSVTASEMTAQSVLILLPLVGFDSQCFRLGYGGGFYDRTLALFREQGRRVRAIGLAFETQLVDGKLPVEPTDEQLHAVVTPRQVYQPNSTG